jgi:hypothetical protein
MRDPTTTTDRIVKKLTNVAYQYLCEREWQELNDALDASFDAIDANFTREPIPWDWRPPTRKRGRPPQRRDRHVQIAGAVEMLVEDTGLKPTRSHLARRQDDPSACSIVAAALDQLGEHLAERTVEGIWNRYHRSPLIIHRGARDYARNHQYRVSS